MRNLIALLLLALVPSLCRADEVTLKTGGRLRGVVLEQTERTVTIDTGPGPVTLPMNRVAKILMGKAFLSEYRERAGRLARSDGDGWLALGEWARAHDLATQAREAFERVLTVDPQNATARKGVGDVNLGGRWMTPDEANLAQGLVRFEGRWMSPAERDALISDRRESERARTEARAREAEARAREAEARARAAAAQSEASQGQWADPTWGLGIPVGCPYAAGCGGGAPIPTTCGPGMSGPACPEAPPSPKTPPPREHHGQSRSPSKRGASAKGSFAAVPAK